MDSVIDLDALAPPKVTVRIGGNEIEINPPKTADILRLASLGQKMGKADDLTPDELQTTISGLIDQVKVCIPELVSYDFNTAQLLRLVQIINEMAVPPDAKELAERGITTDSPKAP